MKSVVGQVAFDAWRVRVDVSVVRALPFRFAELLPDDVGAWAASEHTMEESRYGLHVDVPVEYGRAVELATGALKNEGFGVLTTIDVQQTLKQKLDRDFRKYVILGACNPQLADRALHAELEVGLLLPCNIIVYETSPGWSAVSAMAPMAALGIVGDNRDLKAVAAEADTRLRRALVSLEAASRA